MKKLLFIILTLLTLQGYSQITPTVRTWKVTGTGTDTINLSNRINGKLNISDTGAMLSPYLKKIDTTGKWASPVSVALKKDANDSTNATTGYTTLYQNSLKVSKVIADATYATITNLATKANDNTVFHTNGATEIGSNKWMNASYIALPGEINDMGMTGLFDRNELTIIDKRGGTITTTITGGGSDAGIVSPLVDATGQFYSIGSGTSSTALTINIDMGMLMPNYASAYWQPFVMFRGSFSYFKNITVEVSNDNITWYKPATGWDFSYDATGLFPTGTWMGTRAIPTGLPSYQWRYARFTMTNPIMYLGTNMYITEIGIRHVSAPYARQYVRSDGQDMYGDYQLKNTADAVGDFLTRNSSTGKITRRTPAETLSDIGALSVTGNAVSATKLNTARTINGVAFDGTANITVADATKEPIITSAKVLPNGVTATTQATSDSSNKLSTTAFFKSAPIKANQITTGVIDKNRIPVTNLYAIKGIKGDTTTNAGSITLQSDSSYFDSSISSKQNSLQRILKWLGSNTISTTLGQSAGSNTAAMANGTIYLSAIYISTKDTLTGVTLATGAAFNGNAGAYNGVGLYSVNPATGVYTLVASSINDTNTYKTSSYSMKSIAFSAPYVATAGVYMVAALYTAAAETSAPSMYTQANSDGVVLPNNIKLGSKITGQTSLPATINASATSKNTLYYFSVYK